MTEGGTPIIKIPRFGGCVQPEFVKGGETAAEAETKKPHSMAGAFGYRLSFKVAR